MLNFTKSNRRASSTTEILRNLKPGQDFIIAHDGTTPFSVWLASKRSRLKIPGLRFSTSLRDDPTKRLQDGVYRVYIDQSVTPKEETVEETV